MDLRPELIEAALGARIRELVSMGGDRWMLALADGQRSMVQRFSSTDALTTAEVALSRLRSEIDLPIPQIRRLDVADQPTETPLALFIGIDGEPLARKLPQIPDEALYQIGMRLGQVVYRIHRVAGGRYGALTGDDPCAADEERGYIQARLDHDLAQAIALEALSEEEAAEVRRRVAAVSAAWSSGGAVERRIVAGDAAGGAPRRALDARRGVGVGTRPGLVSGMGACHLSGCL
jgi:hypothetical protein